MKRIKHFLLSIYFALMLGGCGGVGVPEFGDMSTRYADVLEQYQINSLFQNIIRSAHARPLSFLDIPNINGSGSVGISPSAALSFNGGALPANALSNNIMGGLASISPNIGLNLGKSVNFSQASLDNAVFWKGFLTTLPPETLNYFMENNIPPEVIYTMIIDQIKIQTPDGVIHTYDNNPLLDTHSVFQRQLNQLIRNGLIPRYVITSTKIGNVISEARLRKMYGENYRHVLSKDKLSLVQVGAESEKRFQIISTAPGIKFCLKRNPYVNFEKDITRSDFCQAAPITEDEVQESSTKGTRLYLKVRSTSGVYAYLGNVMNAQLQPKPYLVSVPPASLGDDPVLSDPNKYALLVVKMNTKEDRPFAYVDDSLSGSSYLIPQMDSGYSRRTIQILSALQTLQKIPGSISPSPSVLIR
jgi:hypothetical protein